MNWQQVREQYPHKWVIAEAIKAHSEGDQWLVEQLFRQMFFEKKHLPEKQLLIHMLMFLKH